MSFIRVGRVSPARLFCAGGRDGGKLALVFGREDEGLTEEARTCPEIPLKCPRNTSQTPQGQPARHAQCTCLPSSPSAGGSAVLRGSDAPRRAAERVAVAVARCGHLAGARLPGARIEGEQRETRACASMRAFARVLVSRQYMPVRGCVRGRRGCCLPLIGQSFSCCFHMVFSHARTLHAGAVPGEGTGCSAALSEEQQQGGGGGRGAWPGAAARAHHDAASAEG